MKKSTRESIYNKYNKHCAYCGSEIKSIKDMQVDHIIPRARKHQHKEIDINGISNLNPSCRRCNHYKRASSLETFRRFYIGQLHERLAKLYTVKVAMDYGIVE